MRDWLPVDSVTLEMSHSMQVFSYKGRCVLVSYDGQITTDCDLSSHSSRGQKSQIKVSALPGSLQNRRKDCFF